MDMTCTCPKKCYGASAETLLGCVPCETPQFLLSCHGDVDYLAVRVFDTTGKETKAVSEAILGRNDIKVSVYYCQAFFKLEEQVFKTEVNKDFPNL